MSPGNESFPSRLVICNNGKRLVSFVECHILQWLYIIIIVSALTSPCLWKSVLSTIIISAIILLPSAGHFKWHFRLWKPSCTWMPPESCERCLPGQHERLCGLFSSLTLPASSALLSCLHISGRLFTQACGRAQTKSMTDVTRRQSCNYMGSHPLGQSHYPPPSPLHSCSFEGWSALYSGHASALLENTSHSNPERS